MLIDGQEVDSRKSIEEIARDIKALTTGFTRTAEKASLLIPLELARFVDAAVDKFQEWQSNKDSEKAGQLFNDAVNLYEAAAEQATDNVHQALVCAQLGEVLVLGGQTQEGIRFLDATLPVLKEAGVTSKANHTAGKLYMAIGQALKEDPARRQELEEMLRKATKLAFMTVRKASPVNEEAYEVPQGGVGYTDSYNAPIGTANVRDGVYIVIRDPKPPYKTALAHINLSTSENEIDAMLRGMSPSGELLQAKIGGARNIFTDDLPESLQNILNLQNDKSKANLEKIIKVLKSHNVDIVASDIDEHHQPANCVVDATTFEITEAMPAIYHPGIVYANNRGHFVGKAAPHTSPLWCAFDFTLSPHLRPVLLSRKAVAVVQRNLQKSHAKLMDSISPDQYPDPAQRPVIFEGKMVIRESYQDALNYVQTALEEKVKEINANAHSDGPQVSDVLMGYVRKAISNYELCIGKNANIANQPLVDFIQNSLFSLTLDRKHFIADIHRLTKVKLFGDAWMSRLAAEALREQVEHLIEECKQLRGDLEDQAEKLRESADHMKTMIAKLPSIENPLSNEITSHKDVLTKQLEVLTNAVDENVKVNSGMDGDVGTLQDRLDALPVESDDIEALRELRDDGRKRYEEIGDSIWKADAPIFLRYSELVSSLVTQELALLDTRQSLQSADVLSNTDEMNQLAEKVDSVISDLRGTIADLPQDVDTLLDSECLEFGEGRLHEYRLSATEAQRDIVKLENKNLRDELEKAKSEVTGLKDQLFVAEDLLSRLSTQLGGHQNMMDFLTALEKRQALDVVVAGTPLANGVRALHNQIGDRQAQIDGHSSNTKAA